MANFQPPTYNPLAGPDFAANPMLQMALAMYLPQAMGQGNFLPSLMPSQHLFDQFNAAKYQNTRMQGMRGAQAIDQQTLTTNLLGLRGMTTDAPASAMDVEQASNFAGALNNPLMKMFLGQMMGPERMEDMFYGSRGSAESLYQSVARTGFHHRDPATGGAHMSAESLSGMTREMYAQMYGPDANIADMNGISAGRAGVMYEDLFRRGALEKSLGNMAPAERVKAVAEGMPTDEKTMDRLAREYTHQELMRSHTKLLDDKTYAELTPQQQKFQVEEKLKETRPQLEQQFQDIKDYNAGTGKKSIGEIEQMEGFGVAARSIDAQKVTGTLKQYSGAISAVREIFGENGNPNAPMRQLITALDALTQNQIGRVDAKKIERQVREMQIAARESGTGLAAQLGISSQMGAFTDQLGLDRSFAADATLSAMQHGGAMRETGMFKGFGAPSQSEATLQRGYLEAAAAASPIGNMVGVAVRMVEEDPTKHYDAAGNAITPAGAMVQALKSGKNTFRDPMTGEEVDIQQGVTDKQSDFFREQLEKTESRAVIDRTTLDFQGNQEFTQQVKNIGRTTQRADVVGQLGVVVSNAISNNTYTENSETLSDEDRKMLSQITASAFIDSTISSIPPAERPKRLREKIEKDLIANEEKKLEASEPDPIKRRQQAETRARDILQSGYGQTDKDIDATIRQISPMLNRRLTMAAAGANTTAEKLKRQLNEETTQLSERKSEEHRREADLRSEFGDTQSNIVQRFSDLVYDIGSGNKKTSESAVQAMFGVIPTESLEDAMRPGAASVLRLAAGEVRRGLVTTPEELRDLRQKAESKDPAEAAEAVRKLQKYAGDAGKQFTPRSEQELKTLTGDDLKKYHTELDQLMVAAKKSEKEIAPGGEEHVRRGADIVRGFAVGGSGGMSMAAKGTAETLLGDKKNDVAVKGLSEALLAGDADRIKKELATAGVDQDDAQIKELAKVFAGNVDSGRGWDPVRGERQIASARLNTVRNIIGDKKTMDELREKAKSDDPETAKKAKEQLKQYETARAEFELTDEGRRMIQRADSDEKGNYTTEDGKKHNAYSELGGGTAEDNEKFRAELEAAAKKAGQETRQVLDDILSPRSEQQAQQQQQQQTQQAQQQQQQTQAPQRDAPPRFDASGSISSANIRIDRLEAMHIQNATGLRLNSEQTGKVTGSAEPPLAPASPRSVAAGLDSANNAKKSAAVDTFKGAMSELGAIAKEANVPLQTLMTGDIDNLNISEDTKQKAAATFDQLATAAKEINGKDDTVPMSDGADSDTEPLREIARASQVVQQIDEQQKQSQTGAARRTFDPADAAQTLFEQSQQNTTDEIQDTKQKTEQKQETTEWREETKQRTIVQTIPPIHEREEITARTAAVDFEKQIAMINSQRQADTLNGAPGSNKNGGGAQEITGVLQLRGLTEVIINARGKQMEQTPGNGAPVDSAGAGGAYLNV